jgi:hypothetical protein
MVGVMPGVVAAGVGAAAGRSQAGCRARAMAAAELYGALGPTLSSISCCMAGSSP